MKSLEDLAEIRNRTRRQLDVRNSDAPKQVVVGMATLGIAAGARSVLQAFVDEVSRQELEDVSVTQSGAVEKNGMDPVVEITLPGQETITYVKVEPEMVSRIVAETLVGGQPVEEFTISYYEQHNA